MSCNITQVLATADFFHWQYFKEMHVVIIHRTVIHPTITTTDADLRGSWQNEINLDRAEGHQLNLVEAVPLRTSKSLIFLGGTTRIN